MQKHSQIRSHISLFIKVVSYSIQFTRREERREEERERVCVCERGGGGGREGSTKYNVQGMGTIPA